MNEKNPFKQLANPKAPEALKERVMTSVKLSQLLMEMTDLFTNQMGKTALSLFKTDINNPSKNTEND